MLRAWKKSDVSKITFMLSANKEYKSTPKEKNVTTYTCKPTYPRGFSIRFVFAKLGA
jgi:hypothetical protein